LDNISKDFANFKVSRTRLSIRQKTTLPYTTLTCPTPPHPTFPTLLYPTQPNPSLPYPITMLIENIEKLNKNDCPLIKGTFFRHALYTALSFSPYLWPGLLYSIHCFVVVHLFQWELTYSLIYSSVIMNDNPCRLQMITVIGCDNFIIYYVRSDNTFFCKKC